MGVLDQVRRSQAKSVYMTDDQLTVFAAYCVAAHALPMVRRAPRLMISSKTGSHGKSQAMKTGACLVPRPWLITGNNARYGEIRDDMQTHFGSEHGQPTVVFDEASKVFGASGKLGQSSPLYTLLTSGYESDATMPVKSAAGSGGETVPVSIFCTMLIAGLGTCLPGDAVTRTIRLEMSPRPLHVELTPVESRYDELRMLARPLSGWVARRESYIRDAMTRLPSFHSELVDRRGEVWGPLFGIAAADSPDEVDRMCGAFESLGLSKPPEVKTMDERLFLAAAELMGDGVGAGSSALGNVVREWPEFGGKTERELMMMLSSMVGPTKMIRGIGSRGNSAHGWHREYIEFSLSMYDQPDPMTPVSDIYDEMLVSDVSEVSEVSDVGKAPDITV